MQANGVPIGQKSAVSGLWVGMVNEVLKFAMTVGLIGQTEQKCVLNAPNGPSEALALASGIPNLLTKVNR